MNYVLKSLNKTSDVCYPELTTFAKYQLLYRSNVKKEPNSCNTSLCFLREEISHEKDNDQTFIFFVIFCHNLLKTLFDMFKQIPYLSYKVNYFDEHFYGPNTWVSLSLYTHTGIKIDIARKVLPHNVYTLIPWSITPNTYLLSFVKVACYFKVNVHIKKRLLSAKFGEFYKKI